MGRSTLSITMPNYNHGRFLRDALMAVLDQSCAPEEIIVVDDCSTDNSVEILDRMAMEHPLLRIIKNHENKGIVWNIHARLEACSTDYWFGTAADDLIYPGFIEQSMKLLTQHPEAGLSTTMTWAMNADGSNRNILPTPIVSMMPRFIPPEEVRNLLAKHGSWMCGNTCIYRRQPLLEAGGFDAALGPFCDGFIEMALALKYGACFIPAPLTCFRLTGTNYSTTTYMQPEKAAMIHDRALHLMTHTYRDLFTPEIIRTWERSWTFKIRDFRALAAIGERYRTTDLDAKKIPLAMRLAMAAHKFRRLYYAISLGLVPAAVRRAWNRLKWRLFYRQPDGS